MLTLFLHAKALASLLPAMAMLSQSPTFLALWTPLRILCLALPKTVFIKGDDMIFSLYQRLIVFFFEHYTNVEIFLYGEAEQILNNKENAIVICNHQCAVDWVVSEMLALRQGSLGHVRYILKDGLRYFPMYGFYFRQHSCVYVSRNKQFDEERTRKQLEELDGMPYWLIIFPEGTRFDPERKDVLSRSRKFAHDHNLPIVDEVLTPRSKAAYLSSATLVNSADAIYDVTIAYSNTRNDKGERTAAPGMLEFLESQSPQIHIHMKRYSMDTVPVANEDEYRLWLAHKFQEKDLLMKEFYRMNGEDDNRFGNLGQVSKLSHVKTVPAMLFWMALSAPLLLTSTGRSLYTKFALGATLFGLGWMTIRK